MLRTKQQEKTKTLYLLYTTDLLGPVLSFLHLLPGLLDLSIQSILHRGLIQFVVIGHKISRSNQS